MPFIIIVCKFIKDKEIIVTKENIINAIPFLIIAISPIIWLLLMNNHSYYHNYFTYRNLLIFLLGINLFFLNSIQTKKEEKGKGIL